MVMKAQLLVYVYGNWLFTDMIMMDCHEENVRQNLILCRNIASVLQQFCFLEGIVTIYTNLVHV
jgi:hypothetical protein